ncbi:hypothetical protein KZO01_06840 [Kurthia zopfii]|uniref:Uncharacterized protein n=1 Tax=Kurthia zopfii TaxID=1650 RepID=A0A2U3AEJ0_9BACL|nr:hypothetical protein [Kurthia zopfii]PWI22925.1 hypothetical protein DF281_04565 [Kurthia zopfii]TDR40979.1 hypothetical protein DFR61_10799 [Kurthia zopfii]STX09811.1 Uncharacterised protein [Kurthia zopfii]VEI07178.1 Uncharacterised protein [Kurthia zopfii]GEK30375.1 hypothetical protein KZO01_06840 [Kurthia zopfii]
MEYIKVIALFLFIFFLILQIWMGQRAKVIAYFFFIISAAMYVMNFKWELWQQFAAIIGILAIVLGSLYFEMKVKNNEATTEKPENQKTFSDRNKRK